MEDLGSEKAAILVLVIETLVFFEEVSMRATRWLVLFILCFIVAGGVGVVSAQSRRQGAEQQRGGVHLTTGFEDGKVVFKMWEDPPPPQTGAKGGPSDWKPTKDVHIRPPEGEKLDAQPVANSGPSGWASQNNNNGAGITFHATGTNPGCLSTDSEHPSVFKVTPGTNATGSDYGTVIATTNGGSQPPPTLRDQNIKQVFKGDDDHPIPVPTKSVALALPNGDPPPATLAVGETLNLGVSFNYGNLPVVVRVYEPIDADAANESAPYELDELLSIARICSDGSFISAPPAITLDAGGNALISLITQTAGVRFVYIGVDDYADDGIFPSNSDSCRIFKITIQ